MTTTSAIFPKAFYSSPHAYISMWRGLVLVLGALIFAATVFGQIKAGRFPAYRDLAFSALLPLGAYAVLATLTYIGCSLWPVRVGPQGVKSTNLLGVPAFVPWHHIHSAQVRVVQGIPYIYIGAQDRLQPVTVPVWLRDPDGFIQAVKEYAGPSNPLTVLVTGNEA